MLRRVITNHLAPGNDCAAQREKGRVAVSLPRTAYICRARWRSVRPAVYRTFRVSRTLYDHSTMQVLIFIVVFFTAYRFRIGFDLGTPGWVRLG